ncbi:Alpha/beta hydrolase family-domain-containing protein [Apiosordaria backusii]|uniref:Alpha/beta hydrolase family-domain-containing protein n=1 Tax=Apiosordaria backusii TaxID=314023 RepID=A0AA40AXT8_9PEZI|nr:Alpha/beta hydrolase family-domain-containing protein [Apiosordaria backusii]
MLDIWWDGVLKHIFRGQVGPFTRSQDISDMSKDIPTWYAAIVLSTFIIIMAPTQKPTLVHVNGAWHTPASMTKLICSLRALDYEVHCPRLTSVNGARPPNSSLATDSELLRSYISSLVEAGRDVVVIMHSYGGKVGTNALHGLSREARCKQGLSGGIIQLIYVCAFALGEGKSMAGLVAEFGHEEMMPITFHIEEDGGLRFQDARGPLIGDHLGESNEEEVKEYLDSLVPVWNGLCTRDTVTGPAAWRENPVAYVYCTKDNMVPVEYQKSIVRNIEKEGREVKTFVLETGHCPNVTATKELVAVIDRVIAGAGPN